MQTIQFTQSLNVSVTFTVTVPDDYEASDIKELAEEFPSTITVDADSGDDYTVTGISVFGVDINETEILD
jgi:hypothetical protein